MPDLTLQLEGKVAIVTGAARGIGRKTVELFRAHGARVVAEDISETVRELEQPGGVLCLVGDVSEEQTARRAVELAQQSFGAFREKPHLLCTL